MVADTVVSMIVKDEEFYLPMALMSVIDCAKAIVILDTGSTDRTVEIILDFISAYPGKIFLYEDDFGSHDFEGDEFRFAKGFRQTEARDFLREKTLKHCDPDDFILHLDADEVVNGRFWEIMQDPCADSVGHATDLPVTPWKVSTHPLDMQQWGDVRLFDPHVRTWRAKAGGRWFYKENGSDIHPTLVFENQPTIRVVRDNVHFHLHYSMGPKSIYSYLCDTEQTAQGASKILGVPLGRMFDQPYFEQKFPDWFKDGRFIPRNHKSIILWNKHGQFVAPMSHPLPDFVVRKWLEWGDPIEA